jgi:putative ABC transport system substrate-binding protein
VDRRAFITGTLALLAAPLAVEAQPATLPKIGYLSPFSSSGSLVRIEPFLDGLREHGYLDGTNVVVVPRFANQDYQQLPTLAAELVRLRVAVLVALTTPVARVAQRATATIPIVFILVSDPVRTGLVTSLARPGGNLTGQTDITTDLVQKRLALLKEVVPRVSRVGVLKNPDNPGTEIAWTELTSAARHLGLELYGTDVRRGNDLESAFAALTKAHVDSVIVVADFVFVEHTRALARLATSHRLPLMGWSTTLPQAGALISYGADNADVQWQAASYVAKILRGARPGDLPVEQATKFKLVINLKTAKALGLTIPQSVLARADEVIE